MSKLNKKNIFSGFIILLIIVIVYSVYKGCGNGSELVYRYEKVSRGEVKKTISVTGRLEILNSYTVISKISGFVKNVYVDFNQRVSRYQLLADLDSTEIDQKLLKIESERERVAFDLLSAQKDLNAKKDMLKENLISERGMELAKLNYQKISSEMKQIENEKKIIEKSRSYTRILSPSAGIIISREIDANIPIPENKVLFVIAEDLSAMRLVIQVDESDIGLIQKGQSVTFTVSAFPEKIFKGSISQVRLNPITNAQIVSYQSIVTCDNAQLLLKPGMTATATVEVSEKKNVLRVPSEAFIVSPVELKEESDKKYVWRKQTLAIGGMPVERVEVKAGLAGDYFTEIISGKVQEGEEILVGIHKKLEVTESIRQ